MVDYFFLKPKVVEDLSGPRYLAVSLKHTRANDHSLGSKTDKLYVSYLAHPDQSVRFVGFSVYIRANLMVVRNTEVVGNAVTSWRDRVQRVV